MADTTATKTEQTFDRIETQMDNSATLAQQMLTKNDTFIAKLEELAAIPFYSQTDWSLAPSYENESELDVDPPVEPAMPSVTLYSSPAVPTIPEIKTVPPAEVPVYDIDSPVVSFPNKPTQTLPDLPDAPTIEDIEIPDAPTVTLPLPPELDGIVIPDAPDIPVLEEFTSTVPLMDFNPPSATFSYTEAEYTSELNDLIKAKLITYINEGGTGLSEAFETAVYDRARTRGVEAARRDLDEIDNNFSAAGWPTPPGARDARLRRRLRDHLNAELELIDKILIQQTQLAHEWSKFVHTSGISFEEIMIRHFNAVADRTLLAARTVVDAAIAIYNARIANYNAQLEAVKVSAEVYMTKIRAALQNIEYYKAILQGKEIEARVQAQLVDIYRAELDGVRALIQVYATQMDAAKVRSDIERNKVAIYAEQITAYRAQVESKIAEYSAYKAGIEGELGKVQVFSEQVNAYRAQVSAAETKSRTLEINVNSDIQRAKLLLDTYQARIEARGHDVRAYDASVRHALGLFGERTRAYAAKLGRAEAEARMKIRNLELKTEGFRFNAQVMNNAAVQELKNIETLANIKSVAAHSGAQILSTIAGQALSQYQSIAQIMANVETISEEVPATT